MVILSTKCVKSGAFLFSFLFLGICAVFHALLQTAAEVRGVSAHSASAVPICSGANSFPSGSTVMVAPETSGTSC